MSSVGMVRRIRCFWLCVCFLSLASAVSADPQTPATLETSRGLALGSGSRAAATSSSAIAYNPAGLARGRLYHVDSVFTYEPNVGRFSTMASVVDSSTQDSVGAGLAVRTVFGDKDDGYAGIDTRLGLGMELGSAIAIGVSGRYVNLKGNRRVLGADDRLVKGFSMDASIRVTPVEGLDIAALSYNLIDLGAQIAPRMFGGSVSYSFGQSLAIGADWLVDTNGFEDSEHLIGGGVEYLSGNTVPIRLGYSVDTGRDLHHITGGLGYSDAQKKFGADFSIRQEISGGNDTTLMLSARYFVR